MMSTTWDWEYTLDFFPALLDGLRVTIIATVLGTLLAVVLGLVVEVARRAAPAPVAAAINAVVEFIRRTPLLIQLYFLFYALPTWGLTIPALACGVIGLGLHYATYAAEIYRAGIQSVPRGQWDALTALSVPPVASWQRVVFPQAVRPVLPALGNLMIAMFKDSALLSTIAVVELVAQARRAGSLTFQYLEPMTAVAALFLIVSLIASLGIHLLEHKMRPSYERA